MHLYSKLNKVTQAHNMQVYVHHIEDPNVHHIEDLTIT